MSINLELPKEQKEKLLKISKLISGEDRWWFTPSFTSPKCLICNEIFKATSKYVTVANMTMIDLEIDDWVAHHAKKHLDEYDKYFQLESFI